MDRNTLLIIIGVSILAVIILAFVFIRISSHKKSKKLQENLDKYKKENTMTNPDEGAITLPSEQSGEAMTEEEIFSVDEPAANKIEDEVDEDADETDFFSEFENPRDDFIPRQRPPRRVNPMHERERRDKEFEDFLDDHAFSRKVFDKPLLDKIKKLPPEIQSIIIGNVFDRFDSDK